MPAAAAAAGLFSSCASPAASVPTASSFSRSRSMPLIAPLTVSIAGSTLRSSVGYAKASPRNSSPSSSNTTVSVTARVVAR